MLVALLKYGIKPISGAGYNFPSKKQHPDLFLYNDKKCPQTVLSKLILLTEYLQDFVVYSTNLT